MTAEPGPILRLEIPYGKKLTEMIGLIAGTMARDGFWPSSRELSEALGIPDRTVRRHYRVLIQQGRAQEKPGGRLAPAGQAEQALALLNRMALEAHRGQPSIQTLREVDQFLGFGTEWGFPPVWTVTK